MKTLLLLASAAALTGCAAGSKTVATLPPPSFAAPTVTGPAPAPYVPQPLPPKIITVTPTPPRVEKGVPAVASSRDWVPGGKARAWKYIIVHHSATTSGGAVAFDKMHKAKGWDGLGYDFVIGNGTDTRDGQVEVGYRWKQQLTGAHTKTVDNRYNENGIGICLVGNFDIDRPTPAQMQALGRLTAYLMRTYRIAPTSMIGHGDTKPTDCPGRFMNLATVRRIATQNLAATGATPATAARPKTGELLGSATRQ